MPTSEDATIIQDRVAVANDLYDTFREARLNVKFYGAKLGDIQWWNTAIEIAIAIGTSGTLLSLPFFSSTPGRVTVAILGISAAGLSILKPILNLPKQIERASKLRSGYLAVFVSAQRAIRVMQSRESVSGETVASLEEMHERLDSLCADDDPCPKNEKLKRFQAEVNDEYPASNFWLPKADVISHPASATATEASVLLAGSASL